MTTTANPTGAGRTALRSGSKAAGGALRRLVQRWVLFAVLVVIWQIAASTAQDTFFPPPTEILDAAGRMWFSGPASSLFLSGTALGDIGPSLGRLLAGWLIAGAIGTGLGILLGRSERALAYLNPLLHFARSLPPPALVPVFVLLFGIGTPMQLVTIVFGVVWPVLLNAIEGARSVGPVRADTARAFGIRRHRWIFGIVLPSALPKIFAGLRVSMAMALILMIVSELTGSTNGVGYQLSEAQGSFDLPEMWAYIVLLGVLGYVLNAAFLALERRFLDWHHGSSQ